MDKLSQYHIGVAAEAFAAGLLAHAGCNVSVQYGANQPDYDLIAARNSNALMISVKGSQDGAWGLSQYYLKDADYHRAADGLAPFSVPTTKRLFWVLDHLSGLGKLHWA